MSVDYDCFSIFGWSEKDFDFDQLCININKKDPIRTLSELTKEELMEIVCRSIQSKYFIAGSCYSGEINYFIGVPIKNGMTLDDIMALRAGKLRTTMNLVQDYEVKLYEPKFYCEMLVS